MKSQLMPEPHQVRVLALDDHAETRDQIRETLLSQGMECETAENLPIFFQTLEKGDYDVASIDCIIHGRDVQDSVLWSLRKTDPGIGKIVYSVKVYDPRVAKEAELWGADYVVEKYAFNNDNYVKAVKDAARLSFFRRTVSCLKRLGRWTPSLGEKWSDELSDNKEQTLYDQARDALIATLLKGEEDVVLLNLLKRRGVLREFNSLTYINLPFYRKLAELLSFVQVSQKELSKIMEIEISTAERFLSKGEPPIGADAYQRACWLASILDFVLRLANDEPDLMPGFWRATKLYAKSSNIPPWDKSGLKNYLSANGVAGLEAALCWIRTY